MAEEKEINNQDNQNITNYIDNTLNNYDLFHEGNILKNNNNGNGSWIFPDNLVDSKTHTKTTLDVDNYWNFMGTANPRIDVEFYVGTNTWVNINNTGLTINDPYLNNEKSINNHNNYIISANIIDNGPKELELVLYDRNFTDLQKLIAKSISFVDDELNKKNTSKKDDFDAEVINGTNLKFFTSPTKISTNIRIRYGYNENRNAVVEKGWDYKGIGEFKDNETTKSRWRSTETDSEITDEGGTQSIKTDVTLSHHFNQTTLFSNWEYFFITGMNSTLTDSGIKYNIKGISTEEFALNGYKMYQQYSRIVGKPKTVLATLMNMFNGKEGKFDNKSPIKLVWADEDVKASESTINGQELLVDYETGKYELIDEDKKESKAKFLIKPINDLNKYISMLLDIKSCFVNMNNNLKSYSQGKDVEYIQNIDFVTNKKFNVLTEKAQKASYADLIMWPLHNGGNSSYRLDGPVDYGEKLKVMARYQNDVSRNYNFLIGLNKNKDIGWDKRSQVTVKDMMKIWLANIAIDAYDLKEDSKLDEARKAEEQKKIAQSALEKDHTNLSNLVDNINNPLLIKWEIFVPLDINLINKLNLKNNKYYIPDGIHILCDGTSKSINDLTAEDIIRDYYYYYSVDLSKIDSFYNNEVKSSPLSYLSHYLHNVYINDTYIFKEDFDILKDFFDNKFSRKGKIVNFSKIHSFLLDQIDESSVNNSLANTSKKIYTIYKNDYNKYDKIQSLLYILSEIDVTYSIFKDKIVGDMEYMSNGSRIPIFIENNEKWIANGFNINTNLTVNNIDFFTNYLTIKVSNDKYFLLYINDTIYHSDNRKDYEKYSNFMENLIFYLKQVFTFSLDVLNKNSNILGVNFFEEGEHWGHLGTTNLKKYLKSEYISYLNNIIKAKLDDEYKNSNINVDYINHDFSISDSNSLNDEFANQTLRKTLTDTLNNIGKDTENDIESDSKGIISFEIEEKRSEDESPKTEVFGTFNNENLLLTAFNVIKGLRGGLGNEASNKKMIDELLKKIDLKVKYLSEKLENLNKQQEVIDKSNVGKEIELSLGSQESRNSDTKITKTIASLLNDFCSQCEPKISKEELDLKNINKKDSDSQNQNRITIKDESGEDKIVEIYKNLPRYNLTWGIVGQYYSESDKDKKDGIPVVGIYYKKPKNISKLRVYNWGIGNNKPHCIKNINISTGSEFALMHAYNTVTSTNDGQILNSVDQSKGIKSTTKNVTPTKEPCFFTQYFDTERDENLFNNMLNSVSKGSITLLGDPSLRFSGSIQPYTYPIYLNIKLARENNSWYNEDSDEIDKETYIEASQLSGYYVITKITHNISISGYTTTLEIMKYPGSGNAYKDYIQISS